MNISKVLVLAGASTALVASASVALASTDDSSSLNGALKSQLTGFSKATDVAVPRASNSS